MYRFLSSSLPLQLQTDLSKKVALSWHEAEDEVKLFCTEVSDILMHEYKKAQHWQRKGSINSTETEGSSTQSRVTNKTKKRNVKIKKASRSNTLIPSQVVSSRTTTDIVTDQFISSTTPSTISIAAYTQPIMKQVSGPSMWNNCW